MPDHRVLAIDLVTETVLDEVPFDRLEYDHEPLSAHGELGLDVSIRETRSSWLRPGRTLLVVERESGDGTKPVVAHGIVWSRDPDGETWEIQGSGLSSMFDKLHVRHDLTFTADNQDDIVEELVAYAQGLDTGSLGLGTDLSIDHLIAAATTAGAGLARDRTYYGWERKPIGEAIAQLASVIDGFDWRPEVVRLPDNTYARRFVTSYPEFGTTRVDVGLVLGATVDSYGAPQDAARMVTAVDAVGAGEEDGTLIGTWDPGPPTGYPRMEGVYAFRDVVDSATLDAHARAIQESRAAPVSLPGLVLSRRAWDGSWDPLESVQVGDRVPVEIRDETVEVSGNYRLVKRRVVVDGSTGDETVTVDVTAPTAEELPE